MIRAFVRVNVDLDLNWGFSWHHREYPPRWATVTLLYQCPLFPLPLLRKPVFITVQLQKWYESSSFLKLCLML